LKIGAVLRASSGSSGPGRNGVSCRSDIGAPGSGGGGSTTGNRRGLLNRWQAFLAQFPDQQTCAGRSMLPTAGSCPSTKGGNVGQTKRGKGTKWKVLIEGAGPPVGASMETACPAAVTRRE
jgi:hypothetical protein